jgi:hypothetical protein
LLSEAWPTLIMRLFPIRTPSFYLGAHIPGRRPAKLKRVHLLSFWFVLTPSHYPQFVAQHTKDFLSRRYSQIPVDRAVLTARVKPEIPGGLPAPQCLHHLFNLVSCFHVVYYINTILFVESYVLKAKRYPLSVLPPDIEVSGLVFAMVFLLDMELSFLYS